jgi:hypothetical protein
MPLLGSLVQFVMANLQRYQPYGLGTIRTQSVAPINSFLELRRAARKFAALKLYELQNF